MKLKYFFIAALATMAFTACEDLDTAPEGATLTVEQKGTIGEAMPQRAEAGVRGIFAQFNVYMPNKTALNASRHNDFGYPRCTVVTGGEDVLVLHDDGTDVPAETGGTGRGELGHLHEILIRRGSLHESGNIIRIKDSIAGCRHFD